MPPLLAGAGSVIGGGLASAGGGSALLGGLNLAGAGAGLFGALKGLQGGGGGGGNLTPLNPASKILNELFGTRLHKHKHGDDAGTFSLVNDRKNPGLFGGAEFKEALNDFIFNPALPSQGEQDFISQLLGSAPQRLESALSGLSGLRQDASQNFGEARDFARDLATTGFQTDASPFFDTAVSNFQRNILPAIAERTSAFGGGVNSQGFINTAGREGANLLDSAARTNAALAENANARRAGAVPLLGPLAGSEASLLASLLGTEAALPGGFGQDVLNLGTGFRNVFESARGRPLDAFALLAGLGGPGTSQFLQSGFSPQGSATADILSALTSNAGNIAGLLGPLLSGGGGAPGNSPTSIIA